MKPVPTEDEMGTGNPNPRHIAREQESLDRQEIVMRIHLLNKPYRIVNENFHSNKLICEAARAIRELNKDTQRMIDEGKLADLSLRLGE